jgi:hypothetical protein
MQLTRIASFLPCMFLLRLIDWLFYVIEIKASHLYNIHLHAQYIQDDRRFIHFLLIKTDELSTHDNIAN